MLRVVIDTNVLVSGDHHLLEIGVYKEIPILTARQFLERLRTA